MPEFRVTCLLLDQLSMRPADETNYQQTELVIDDMETLPGMLGTVLELNEKVEH